MPELCASILTGFNKHEFADLDPACRKRLLTLMARIAESSYRRGVDHAVHMQVMGRKLRVPDLQHWRYVTSLDQSISPFDKSETTSFVRLACEHTGALVELGFSEILFGIDDNATI